MNERSNHSEDQFEERREIIPPSNIIKAYSDGYFPMAESSRADSDIFFYTAPMRGIIPMDEFRISKRSRRYFRKYGFEMALNQHFEDVIEGCADRESTWINPIIRDTFLYLHQLGIAHSVEVLKEGELVGGLYGLALGGAFFAESVFQYHDEAHKAALYFCHKHLKEREFELWDVQFKTDHLSTFGCIEVPAKKYKKMLHEAIRLQRSFQAGSNTHSIADS